MLVLSRKVTDEIVIGNSIRVVVLKVNRRRVTLGLTAPSDVAIRREEICRREPQRPGREPRQRSPNGEKRSYTPVAPVSDDQA